MDEEELADDQVDKDKGHDFGGYGSKMTNSHIMETFNPLRKFYMAQPALGKQADKGKSEAKET